MNNIDKLTGLARDKKSKALLSLDEEGFTGYKNQRSSAIRLKLMKEEVQELKADMSHIKKLLEQLVNGKNNG